MNIPNFLTGALLGLRGGLSEFSDRLKGGEK